MNLENIDKAQRQIREIKELRSAISWTKKVESVTIKGNQRTSEINCHQLNNAIISFLESTLSHLESELKTL